MILPTRTLPSEPSTTDESPAPSVAASASPQLAEPEANTAAERYLEGRRLVDSLYTSDDPGYSDDLERYFSGDYLDFWQQDLEYVSRNGLEIEGTARVGVVNASQVDRAGDQLRVSLVACVDYSSSTTFDAQGEVDRGFDRLIDEVYMVKSGTSPWMADGINSEPVDSFAGSDCEAMK